MRGAVVSLLVLLATPAVAGEVPSAPSLSLSVEVTTWRPTPGMVPPAPYRLQQDDDGDEDGEDGAPLAVPVAPELGLDDLDLEDAKAVRKLRRGRNLRYVGWAMGLGSLGLAFAGGGAINRANLCPAFCDGLNQVGNGLLVGALFSLEIGAAVGLVGSGMERRALLDLGAHSVSEFGMIGGWSFYASQLIFLPIIGAAAAYWGIHRQGMTNRYAYTRLLRDVRRVEVSVGPGTVQIRF